MTAEVVKHVEAAELGLEDEDEEDVGTKDRALGEAASDRCDRCDLSKPPRPGPCYRLQRVYAVVSCASAKDAWTQGPTNVGFGHGKHRIHSARDLELAALRKGCKAVMMPPRNCVSPRLMWSPSDTTSNFQADWPWGFPCLASLWNCNNGSQFLRLLEDSTPGIERWIRWGRKPGSDSVALSEHLENFQFNITVWACFLILPEVNGNYDIDHSVPAPAPLWWDESKVRYNLCNGNGSYLIEAAHQLLFNEFDVEWKGLRLKFWFRNGLFVASISEVDTGGIAALQHVSACEFLGWGILPRKWWTQDMWTPWLRRSMGSSELQCDGVLECF